MKTKIIIALLFSFSFYGKTLKVNCYEPTPFGKKASVTGTIVTEEGSNKVLGSFEVKIKDKKKFKWKNLGKISLKGIKTNLLGLDNYLFYNKEKSLLKGIFLRDSLKSASAVVLNNVSSYKTYCLFRD